MSTTVPQFDDLAGCIPFPSVHLTDAAWLSISKRFNLPEEARLPLDRIASFYCMKKWTLGKTPAFTQKQLHDVAACSLKLHKLIGETAENPRACVVLRGEGLPADSKNSQQTPDPTFLLAAAQSAVMELNLQVMRASERLCLGSRGDHEGKLFAGLTVGSLAQFWEFYTDSPFTRTKKGQATPLDFLNAVFEAIAADIDSSRIETAAKAFIRRRCQISRKSPA